MTIRVAPFTVYPSCEFTAPPTEKGKHVSKTRLPITYWGIYLDDEFISYTSSEELAEETKLWAEKWLKHMS